MNQPNLGEEVYALTLKNASPLMAKLWADVHVVRDEIMLTLKRGEAKLLDSAPSWYTITLQFSQRLISIFNRSNVNGIKKNVKNDLILEGADHFVYLHAVARDLINAMLHFLSGLYTMAGKGPIPGSNMARRRRPPHRPNHAKKK